MLLYRITGLSIFLWWVMTTVASAQTVMDYVHRIDTEFDDPYQEGELWANDSIIDLPNGFYQRSFYADLTRPTDEKVLRQVAVFNNADGTKTIIEATSFYNFVCWTNRLRFFYDDGQTLQTFHPNDHDYFLPPIRDAELLSETALSIFKKYFQRANPAIVPSFAAFVNEAYDNPRYVLPRYGTDIVVHLDFCDYFGTDLDLDFAEDDWATFQEGVVPLRLSYDKVHKQFRR